VKFLRAPIPRKRLGSITIVKSFASNLQLAHKICKLVRKIEYVVERPKHERQVVLSPPVKYVNKGLTIKDVCSQEVLQMRTSILFVLKLRIFRNLCARTKGLSQCGQFTDKEVNFCDFVRTSFLDGP